MERKVGVESTTFFFPTSKRQSKQQYASSIHYAQNGELFEGSHNGADIVNWQVEKGGFGWK